jgi:hypothetical protein
LDFSRGYLEVDRLNVKETWKKFTDAPATSSYGDLLFPLEHSQWYWLEDSLASFFIQLDIINVSFPYYSLYE